MRYKWWKTLRTQQLSQIHTNMTTLVMSFVTNICLPSYVFIVPVDFGQHNVMYLSKVNIILCILFSTVYMQLGAAVNVIYGKK